MTKEKKGFMDVYKKRYDPKVEGYGSPSQWQSSFKKRMSLDEAKEYVKDQSPYSILEVENNSNWELVKKAFKKMAMKHHPDKNPDNVIEATKKMQQILAAYTIIKNLLKK